MLHDRGNKWDEWIDLNHAMDRFAPLHSRSRFKPPAQIGAEMKVSDGAGKWFRVGMCAVLGQYYYPLLMCSVWRCV